MSSSRGRGFELDDGIDWAGVDPLRHALCALSPESADVEFSRRQLDELTRTGLLGAIANPSHRVLTLLWTRFEGNVDTGVWNTEARGELHSAATALQAIGEAMRSVRLRKALQHLHELGATINRRLAASEPWHLGDVEAHRELVRLLPYVDALGVAAFPIVPRTSRNLRAALGRPREPGSWSVDTSPPRLVEKPRPPLELRRASRDHAPLA